MNRMLTAGVVIAVLVGVSAVLARAQPRNNNSEPSSVSIRHIELDAGSQPLPVLSKSGSIERGGLYEIYFNGSVELPLLGQRRKLFVLIKDVAPDGWLRVDYGDGVTNQGSFNATLAEPAQLPIPGQVPRTNLDFNLHYTMIAGMSVRLNRDDDMARYWPE